MRSTLAGFAALGVLAGFASYASEGTRPSRPDRPSASHDPRDGAALECYAGPGVASEVFQLRVHGRRVEVLSYKDFDYAHFAIGGAATDAAA